MTAKKINNLDAYRKEVFQSPFMGAFFALDQAAAFEAHLREQTKTQKNRDNAALRRDARMQFWTALREQTSSVQDLEQRLNAIPDDILNHYKKNLSGPGGPAKKLKSTLTMAFSEQGKRSYGMRSTTHHSPIGEGTNWGGWDGTRASSRLGLKIPAAQSPNELMRLAEKESGMCTEMNNYVLFAKDWPFVAQNALWLVLNEVIQSRPTLLTGEVNKDHAQFLADIEHASLQCTGMSYGVLKSMVDSLGVDLPAFNSMVDQYKMQAASGPALSLPPNMLDEPTI